MDIDAVFHTLFMHVRKNGEKTSQAKSAYGADAWELPLDDGTVRVSLEDDGYTHGIFSGDIQVRKTHGRTYEFHKGTVEDLAELFKQVFIESQRPKDEHESHPIRDFWRNDSGWYDATSHQTPEEGMSEGRLCIDTWNHAVEACLQHVTKRDDIKEIRGKIKELRYEI